MIRPFFGIQRKIFAIILAWAVCMIVCAWLILSTPFVADMSAFLPRKPTAQQQLLVDQLKEGIASRVIIVGIRAAPNQDASASVTPAQLAVYSKALVAQLKTSSLFSLVANGDNSTESNIAQSASKEQNLLFEYRYHLSPRVTQAAFTAEGLNIALKDGLSELAMGGGLLSKALFFKDPTGETMTLIDRVVPSTQPFSLHGVWFSKDQNRAVMVLQTRAQGSDLDAQQAALIAVDAAFFSVAQTQALPATKVQLLKTGAPVYAVQSRASIESEAKLFSTIGTAIIIVLLLLVYRSPRLLALGLFPVITGAVAGLAAVALGFGSVHGITLGFGVTLIGEAVDYAIYFFIQQAGDESAQRRQEQFRELFWPTIRLGVLTSICGFCALLFSGFTGLAQLGLFSIAGLSAAALMTRFVLPHCLPAQLPIRIPTSLETFALAGARRVQSWRKTLFAVSAACVVLLVFKSNTLWQNELSALSPVSSTMQALDATLRGDISTPEMGYLLLSKSLTQQAALEQAERISAQLDDLVKQSIIASFESVSTYIPSVATQTMRLAALPSTGVLQVNLAAAVTGLPVKTAALQGFVNDIAQAKIRSPIQPKDLEGSALGAAVANLLIHQKDGYLSYFPIRAAEGKTLDAARVNQALLAAGIQGANVLDIKAEADGMYAQYVNEALLLSGLGLFVIALLLRYTLNSWNRALLVLLPQLLAVLWVMAMLAALGVRLNLLHLVGMLLVVAVGSNYGLFFDQANRASINAKVLVSLMLANATTVIGFGILALSSVPVLQAFGLTVGPGAWFALLLSAALAQGNEADKTPARSRVLPIKHPQ
jgi:predicted exporter